MATGMKILLKKLTTVREIVKQNMRAKQCAPLLYQGLLALHPGSMYGAGIHNHRNITDLCTTPAPPDTGPPSYILNVADSYMLPGPGMYVFYTF